MLLTSKTATADNKVVVQFDTTTVAYFQQTMIRKRQWVALALLLCVLFQILLNNQSYSATALDLLTIARNSSFLLLAWTAGEAFGAEYLVDVVYLFQTSPRR